MGDVRRRAATTTSALLLSALVVAPAASALGDREHARQAHGAGAALTAQAEGAAPHEHDAGDFQNSIVEAAHLNAEAAAADGAQPQAAALPTGFADQKVITGMSEAVSADFAPDGTAFIALKTGQIKVAAYNAGTDAWGTATDFADLTDEVNNYGDRGLTGIAVDPQFPTRPYVYVNYTYDKDPRDGTGGTVPKWGKGTAYDDCTTPANENDTRVTGCIVQDRVTRLTASKASGSWRMAAEKELLVGGCYQFSSHASGDVAFGPDGKLYASSGEGASFNTLDSGQYANACGDPADEGGSLRSQDYRSTGDPLGVDGSVFRMDPDTGVVPTQQNASSWLVAYGQRNPWRLTFRTKADGTGLSNQLWSVDVGASKAEEVNRISDVTAVPTPVNRGWPCYEGGLPGVQGPARLGRAEPLLVRDAVQPGTHRGAEAGLQLPDPRRWPARDRRGLRQRDLVGLRCRLRQPVGDGPEERERLPSGVPQRDVLLRLRPLLHLGPGQGCRRRAGPDVDQHLRPAGGDADRPAHRPGRRPVLRRLRHHGGRERRPGHRRRAPHRLHRQQRHADRAHHRRPALGDGSAHGPLQRRHLDRSGRRLPHLPLGLRERRDVGRHRRDGHQDLRHRHLHGQARGERRARPHPHDHRAGPGGQQRPPGSPR
ncbi:hypothetical protein G5V58_23650 [Nocardioides anomalus]|uniref:Glucose/Sorbosone dehydrogenase domain-containing protein n=1 Tax=Nocardioides anomalus TaxID=2712223 RepID=A0A6G6WJ41_9ACTN|nr:hypothetical protein G5V58_23650 [Nocardioides anomalus]